MEVKKQKKRRNILRSDKASKSRKILATNLQQIKNLLKTKRFLDPNIESNIEEQKIYKNLLELEKKIVKERIKLNLKISNEKINFIYDQGTKLLEELNEKNVLEAIIKPNIKPELISLKAMIQSGEKDDEI